MRVGTVGWGGAAGLSGAVYAAHPSFCSQSFCAGAAGCERGFSAGGRGGEACADRTFHV